MERTKLQFDAAASAVMFSFMRVGFSREYAIVIAAALMHCSDDPRFQELVGVNAVEQLNQLIDVTKYRHATRKAA